MCKEAGRPWPIVCKDDDVIDFMIMEAVAVKVHHEDVHAQEKAEKDREREEWKKTKNPDLTKHLT